MTRRTAGRDEQGHDRGATSRLGFLIDALTYLREHGLVPWDDIID